MSDFMSRDILPDLWDEILKRHWTFLETDGSMQQIEEGKKLENCLREFLCIVPHDRKFFLPETAHVLKKSVRELDKFNAYKAIIGFRSISEYANNLFTKPWRKEFRVLKIYSGFYQHEVKSNLLDAEKMFEAMGYRQISDQILVLDGPICPDQVTNVSRDAMAAYVECQIIAYIYAGLIALGLTCSWQDVFHYREKCVGGSSHAIKALAYAIKEKRKEKCINPDNCYASIQHLPQTLNITPTQSECPNCAIYSRMPALKQYPIQNCNHGTCAFNVPVSTTVTNNLYNGKLELGHQHPHHSGYGVSSVGMQHSRSLEHYSEPVAQLPHRHSFDHQQKGCTAHHYKPPHQLPPQNVYESPYDCLDGASMGGSSVSYAAVVASGGGSNNGVNNYSINAAYSHPYNVSGNRYPLPYNISNQLNSHYETPNVICNGIKSDHYNNLDNGGYASVSKAHNCNYHQPPKPSIRQSSVVSGGKDFQAYRQRSFPPDQQQIEFDDRAPLTSHDFHAQFQGVSHCNSFDYDREQDRERERDRIIDQQPRLYRTSNITAAYAQPKDIVMPQQCAPYSGIQSVSQQPSSDDMYGSYTYARPLPKADRTKFNLSTTNMTPKYERNSNALDVLDNNEKQMHLQTMELKDTTTQINGVSGNRRKISTNTNEASDMNYDSNFDDFVTVGHSEHPLQRSPTQASKNQDGVGSFESWNYVFQKLERSGYSKDLGERSDLLVQGLDLDSMNLSNGGVGNGGGNKVSTERRRQTNNDIGKSHTLDKTNPTIAQRESDKRDEKKGGTGYIKQQEKSILKQPGKKTKSVLRQASNIPPAHDNNNGNNEFQTGKNNRTKNNKKQASVNTQSNMSSQGEWSCHYCTFLNPETIGICEMCAHSKNFKAIVSHTPTCV